jgi:hypothetical protein
MTLNDRVMAISQLLICRQLSNPVSYGNVSPFQLAISRDQRRLCSGSAQALLPPPCQLRKRARIEKEDKRGTLQVSSQNHVTLLRVAVIAYHPYIYNPDYLVILSLGYYLFLPLLLYFSYCSGRCSRRSRGHARDLHM